MKLLELENFWQLIFFVKKLVAEIYIRVRMKRNFYFDSNFAETKGRVEMFFLGESIFLASIPP